MRCAYAEDVVAHFHDGAVPATTDAATLAEHLHGCETCQRTLAHARRIDGLLASISGVDVDPLLAERLLGKLPDPEPRARPLLRGTAALLLVASGFAAAWLLWGRGAEQSEPDAPHERTANAPQVAPQVVGEGDAVTPSPPLDPNHVLLPDLPVRRRTPSPSFRDPFTEARTAAELQQVAEWIAVPGLEEALLAHRLGLHAAAGAPAWSLQALFRRAQQVADADAAALRLRAARALLAAGNREGFPRLARAADALGPGRAGSSLLALLRSDARFTRWLARELAVTREPGQALRLAARIGGSELDAALRVWAGRDHTRLLQAGDAVAQARTHPDPVPLQLALWRVLDQTGGRSDPFPLAVRWFAPLGTQVAPRIVEIARTTGSAVERTRCLHALAALPSADASGFLLELLDGPRHHERLLASHALGRLVEPRAASELCHELRRRLPRSRSPELLLVTLLSLGDPQAIASLERSGLPPDARALLRSGRFSLEQIPTVLALLPDHGIENL